MTESITCDRCGTAVPQDEWEHHANATIVLQWTQNSTTGEYERGPIECHLCGDCTAWLDDEVGGAIPAKWDRWSSENGDAEDLE